MFERLVVGSLGALQCSPNALRLADSHPTEARTVSDAEAVSACCTLLDEHRVLVEPACGAALALLTSEKRRADVRWAERFASPDAPVVVIVCGGSGVTREILQSWL